MKNHFKGLAPTFANAALVIGFLLWAGPAAAQSNLLTNPGFETGDTTGWFPFGSPTLTAESTQVHSGTYACSVTGRTGTYMGAAQSLELRGLAPRLVIAEQRRQTEVFAY